MSGPFVPDAMRGKTLGGNGSFVAVCDWYATFCDIAGVPADDTGAVDSTGKPLPTIDSLSMWPFISGKVAASPRTEVPLTMGHHQPGCGGGIIADGWKLLLGTQSPAFWNGPEYPNGTKPSPISVSCGDGCLYDVVSEYACR